MRTLAFLVLAGLLLAGCSKPHAPAPEGASATTGSIRGVAFDAAIRPLAGVTVTLSGPDLAAITDGSRVTGDDGAFAFQGLAPGDYFVAATKPGFQDRRTSATVVAGVDDPANLKLELATIPSLQPFAEARSLHGYLTFGAALGVTSLGTTVLPLLADNLTDTSTWILQYDQLPDWVQGELVWEQGPSTGGMMIWEMTNTSNTPAGYHETAASPALAYWDTSVLDEPSHVASTLDPARGIAFRFFAGPHPMLAPGGPVLPPPSTCPPVPGQVYNPCAYGVGATAQQGVDAYVHNFYNFVPPEGWRFTNDGPPVVPST